MRKLRNPADSRAKHTEDVRNALSRAEATWRVGGQKPQGHPVKYYTGDNSDGQDESL